MNKAGNNDIGYFFRLARCLSCLCVGASLGLFVAPPVAADDVDVARAKLVNAAVLAHSNSEDETAVKLLNKALSITKDPHLRIGILNGLAASYFGLKQYEASIKASDQAIAAVPIGARKGKVSERAAGSYYQRSKSEVALGRRDQAIADLTMLVEAFPLNGSYVAWRARLYTEMGRNNDAVNDLTTTLALNAARSRASSKSSEVYKFRALRVEYLNLRAKAYQRLGKMKEYNQDTAEANKLTEDL